jgi:hypothetical protein
MPNTKYDAVADLKSRLYEEADKCLKIFEDKIDQAYKDAPKAMALLEKDYLAYYHPGINGLNVCLSAIPNDDYSAYVLDLLTAGRPLKVFEHLLGNKEDMPRALLSVESYCKKNKLPALKAKDQVLVKLLILITLEGRHYTIPMETIHKHPSSAKLKCYDIKE